MKNYNYQWSNDFPGWPEDNLIIRANELPVGIYRAKVVADEFKVFQYKNDKWVYINNLSEIDLECDTLIIGVFELLKPFKHYRYATLGIDVNTLNLPKGQIIEFQVLEGKRYVMIRQTG